MPKRSVSILPWRRPSSEWDRRPEEAKRASVREVAVRMIAERGLDGTHTNQIIARSGVVAGTFYRLYPSKFHIVDEIACTYLDRLYTVLDGAALDALPGRERLGAMARVLARTACAERDAHRVLALSLATLPPAERDAMRTRISWLYAGIAEAVSLRLPRLARPAAEERAWQLMLLLAAPALWAEDRDERAAVLAADAAVALVVGGRRRPARG